MEMLTEEPISRIFSFHLQDTFNHNPSKAGASLLKLLLQPWHKLTRQELTPLTKKAKGHKWYHFYCPTSQKQHVRFISQTITTFIYTHHITNVSMLYKIKILWDFILHYKTLSHQMQCPLCGESPPEVLVVFWSCACWNCLPRCGDQLTAQLRGCHFVFCSNEHSKHSWLIMDSPGLKNQIFVQIYESQRRGWNYSISHVCWKLLLRLLVLENSQNHQKSFRLR